MPTDRKTAAPPRAAKKPTTEQRLRALEDVVAELETQVAGQSAEPRKIVSSIAEKWSAILGALDAIPRRGHAKIELRSGGSYEYEYVLESDLMEALRPLLAEHRLAAFYSDEILEQHPIGDKGWMQTTVRVTVTLIDPDSGEKLSFSSDDTVQDFGDKGPRKAKTGAMRYLLLKGTFNPSDALDDPDHPDHAQRLETGDRSTTAEKTEPPKTSTRAARSRTTSDEPRDVRLRRTIVTRTNEFDEVAENEPGTTLGAIVAELGTDLDGLDEDSLVALGSALSKKLDEARTAKHDGNAVEPFRVPANVKPVPFG